ncbi:MAG: hypothetical protein KAH22_08205 [Thiotrichaceae bacterium]|nr:hypothetical protein [Thiotrichaceae bacterium]
MLRSLLAVVAGVFFILLAILVLQLIFLLVIVEYNSISKEMTFLNGIGQYSKYLIAIPSFLVIMFVGGMITASTVKSQWLVHCIAVAVISIIAMILPLLTTTDLTSTGGIIFVLCFLSIIAGGWYSERRVNRGKVDLEAKPLLIRDQS